MRADPRRSQVPAHVAALALGLALALGAAPGCAREPGPPPIADGAECATCGMSAGNRRFACEQQVDGRWRVYDSIECLAGDREVARAGAARQGRPRVYLADYDTRTLHAADSLHVVHGSFSSPMGGGYAAFADRAAADSLAAATRGRVLPFAELLAGAADRAGAGASGDAGARP